MNPRDLLNAAVAEVRVFVEHNHQRESRSETYFDRLNLEFRVPLAKPEKIRKTRRIGSLDVDVVVCGVRLIEKATVVVAGWDPIERTQAAMKRLVDAVATDVSVTTPGGDARIEFDNGLALILFPARSRREEAWRVESSET